MGVTGVADGHHSVMASEHVATDLAVPAVWRPVGADTPTPSLADRPVRSVDARHATVISVGPDSDPPRETVPQRLTELLAAMSVVLDAAERRPEGHAVRTAFICGQIGAELSLPDDLRADLLFAGLLSDVGTIGPGPDPVPDTARKRGSGVSRYRRDTTPSHLSRPPRARAVIATLGLSGRVADAIATADERWDGRGPSRIHGARIPRGGRLVALAAAVAALGDTAAAVDIDRLLRTERGRSLDPGLVDEVLRMGRAGLWAEIHDPSLLDRMLALEPAAAITWAQDRHLDAAALAFADVVDTRTPRMGRHSRRVADFTVRTGTELGLDAPLLVDLRRAALLHDIGKLLVPISYLEKPAELTDTERRVIEEHARAGAAVMGRSRAFARLAPLTVAHHERLDGNGMFPAVADEAIALAARVVALSDRYEAMTAERPYRPLLAPAQVWSILDEVVGEPLARTALRALRRAVVDAA
jgi:HD-GYP domain-containing protein (c-di-GMP phosphodiesterase class II)